MDLPLTDFFVALALHPSLVLHVLEVVLLLLLDVLHDLEELGLGLVWLHEGRFEIGDARRRFHEIFLPIQGRLVNLDNHARVFLRIDRSIFSRGRGNFCFLVEREQVLATGRLEAGVLSYNFRLELAYRILKLLDVQVVEARGDLRSATCSVWRAGLRGVLLRMRISHALLLLLRK